MRKRILFLTNLLPFPLDNGGKIKSFNTLKALSYDYDIDLVCFVNDKKDLKHVESLKTLTKSIDAIEKKIIRGTSKKRFIVDYIKSLCSKLPYSVNKFNNKEMRKVIQEKVKTNYCFIYVDHLPMMVYYDSLKNNKIILDEHNVETIIFKRIIRTSSGLIKKVLGAFECYKLKKFEMRSLPKCNHVICLSEEDKSSLLRLAPQLEENNISVLPIHLEMGKNVPSKIINNNEKLRLLFLGSMSWYPNQQGIVWFMENVWPFLTEDTYQIYIVGGSPPESVKRYHDSINIFVTGYVENVDQYINTCDVSLVPLFIGSGQRVKIIESFAKGIPVVSTTIGAEGLICENRENIFIADTAEEFINTMNEIENNRTLLNSIITNARDNFETHYSVKLLPQKLKRIIEIALN